MLGGVGRGLPVSPLRPFRHLSLNITPKVLGKAYAKNLQQEKKQRNIYYQRNIGLLHTLQSGESDHAENENLGIITRKT